LQQQSIAAAPKSNGKDSQMALLDKLFHNSTDDAAAAADVKQAEHTNNPEQSYMTEDPQLGVQRDASTQDPQLAGDQRDSSIQDPQLAGNQQDSSIQDPQLAGSQQDSSIQDPQVGGEQNYQPQDQSSVSQDSWNGEQRSEPQGQQAEDFTSGDQQGFGEGEPTHEVTEQPNVDPSADEPSGEFNN